MTEAVQVIMDGVVAQDDGSATLWAEDMSDVKYEVDLRYLFDVSTHYDVYFVLSVPS